MTTKYINFLGGPGSGKSTSATSLFSRMKKQRMNVELVTEVAKDFVWENRSKTLEIQPYVSAKQFRNLVRLKGLVDYVVTDASILMGLIYADKYTSYLPQSYFDSIFDLNNEILTPSTNIFIERSVKYDTVGRIQTEEEAIKIDNDILNMLTKQSISFKIMSSDEIGSAPIEELIS